MKIAILYICTGAYAEFWTTFHTSSEKYFATDYQKHYFVFTDAETIRPASYVEVIAQDSLGWPFNTLYRFRMFLRVDKLLRSFDKVVFFNANCEFKSDVSMLEFFGDDKDLVACTHPGFYDKDPNHFTFERRPASTAYVRNGVRYFQGALIGGAADIFLQACATLHRNIETDLEEGLMAVWHDESHWNAYLNTHYCAAANRLHVLSPAFLYPEDWSLPFEPKICLRDKSKVIDIGLIKNTLAAQMPTAPKSFSRLRRLLARV